MPRSSMRPLDWLHSVRLFRSVLDSMPLRCRPALFFDTFYNVGLGAFIALFGLSAAVLKSDQVFSPSGSKEDLMCIAAMFGGSSLLSPLVSYLGKRIPMRLLIIYPTLAVAALLLATGFVHNATAFALLIGLAFVVQVFPRVGEMNMYRVLYPVTHRGAAVGWVKAVSAVSGLAVTVVGTQWFLWKPGLYHWAYWAVAIALATSALAYARIPVRRRNEFADESGTRPLTAFLSGVRVFLGDRRFILYQVGFWFAGFANHMAHAYVAESLKEDVHASDTAVFWIVAVVPAVLMSASAPFWGRYLDRINPMTGRAIFNGLQGVAYAFHFYGGMSQQVWPFAVGSIAHAIANGGGTINWLTGSLYFARQEHVSLYNSIHVALTGVRGLSAPIFGVWLYGSTLNLGPITVAGLGLGPVLFAVSAVLSFAGTLFMVWMARGDTGPAEQRG